MCITESLCCIADWQSTVNQLYYNKKINLIKLKKNMAQMNLSMKQKQNHVHREQAGGCRGGGGCGRDGVGVWGWQMSAFI